MGPPFREHSSKVEQQAYTLCSARSARDLGSSPSTPTIEGKRLASKPPAKRLRAKNPAGFESPALCHLDT